jgi:CBS domain-containing protein
MLRNLPVRDLMITDVLTFTPDQNVHVAMRALVEREVDGAPVIDEDRQVVGVLSVADIIVEESRLHFPTIVNLFGVNVALPWNDKELDESVSKALGEYVGEVMTTEPITIGPDATVEDVATLMHDKQISRVPVVGSDGVLVGLITRTDILRAMVRGLDNPSIYDAGEEAADRLGEGSTAELDATARERRAAREATRLGPQAAAVSREQAHAEEREFGTDVGRI